MHRLHSASGKVPSQCKTNTIYYILSIMNLSIKCVAKQIAASPTIIKLMNVDLKSWTNFLMGLFQALRSPILCSSPIFPLFHFTLLPNSPCIQALALHPLFPISVCKPYNISPTLILIHLYQNCYYLIKCIKMMQSIQFFIFPCIIYYLFSF